MSWNGIPSRRFRNTGVRFSIVFEESRDYSFDEGYYDAIAAVSAKCGSQ